MNAECKVLDTIPVRTMVCVCVVGYQGNAAVQCDLSEYRIEYFPSVFHLADVFIYIFLLQHHCVVLTKDIFVTRMEIVCARPALLWIVTANANYVALKMAIGSMKPDVVSVHSSVASSSMNVVDVSVLSNMAIV